MSYGNLDRHYTDGTVTMDGRELIKHLWRNLTDEQEDAFAQYVNDTFTPWDVLLDCDPYSGDPSRTRYEFFEDWVSDMVMYHDDELEEIFGFKEGVQ